MYDVLPGYAGFEGPGQSLHEEVVRLTGITDDQLRGQKLDEQAATLLAVAVNLIGVRQTPLAEECRIRMPISASHQASTNRQEGG